MHHHQSSGPGWTASERDPAGQGDADDFSRPMARREHQKKRLTRVFGGSTGHHYRTWLRLWWDRFTSDLKHYGSICTDVHAGGTSQRWRPALLACRSVEVVDLHIGPSEVAVAYPPSFTVMVIVISPRVSPSTVTRGSPSFSDEHGDQSPGCCWFSVRGPDHDQGPVQLRG